MRLALHPTTGLPFVAFIVSGGGMTVRGRQGEGDSPFLGMAGLGSGAGTRPPKPTTPKHMATQY
jgi:hypothetical protein